MPHTPTTSTITTSFSLWLSERTKWRGGNKYELRRYGCLLVLAKLICRTDSPWNVVLSHVCFAYRSLILRSPCVQRALTVRSFTVQKAFTIHSALWGWKIYISIFERKHRGRCLFHFLNVSDFIELRIHWTSWVSLSK